MYPFHLINAYKDFWETEFLKFAKKLNSKIFPFINHAINSASVNPAIKRDANDIYELLAEIQAEYGDWVDQKVLEEKIRNNLHLLDAWSVSKSNEFLKNQAEAYNPNSIYDKPRVPLLNPKDPLALDNITLASRNQKLLQNQLYAEHFAQVEGIINDGILSGKTASEITDEILAKVDMNAKRARFWAEDQAAIFQSEQTRVRALRSGQKYYRWVILGKNTRESHRVHSGQICSWNVGVNNLTRPGARHPGEDYRCHCVAQTLGNDDPELIKFLNQNPGFGATPRAPQSVEGLIENYGTGLGVSSGEGVKSFTQAALQAAQTNFLIIKTNKLPIENAEPLIANQEVETILAYNSNGSFINGMVGTNEKAQVWVKMNEIKGGSITHNHPLGSPPSLEDLESFTGFELSEMRVVTSNGDLFALRNRNRVKLDFSKVKQTYERVVDEAKVIARKKMENGIIDKKDLDYETKHVRLELTAREHGFIYDRKKW